MMTVDELINQLENSRTAFDPIVNDYYGTEAREKIAVIHFSLLNEVISYLKIAALIELAKN